MKELFEDEINEMAKAPQLELSKCCGYPKVLQDKGIVSKWECGKCGLPFEPEKVCEVFKKTGGHYFTGSGIRICCEPEKEEKKCPKDYTSMANCTCPQDTEDWQNQLLELLKKEQYTTTCPSSVPKHKNLINFIRNLIQKEREEAQLELIKDQEAGKIPYYNNVQINQARQDAFKECMHIILKANRFVPKIAVEMIEENITRLLEKSNE